MIKIIDNFLTPSYADAISHDMMNVLHYHYTPLTTTHPYGGDVYTDSNTHDYGHFVCPMYNAEDQRGNFPFAWYFQTLRPLINTIQDSLTDLEVTSIVRVKGNLMKRESSAPEFHYNIPHQDAQRGNYSAIYYVNDSDGDTFLFNEFYTEQKPIPDKLTVAKRITPKKNRIVIFESDRYHAASTPRISRERMVLNFIFNVRPK